MAKDLSTFWVLQAGNLHNESLRVLIMFSKLEQWQLHDELSLSPKYRYASHEMQSWDLLRDLITHRISRFQRMFSLLFEDHHACGDGIGSSLNCNSRSKLPR